MKKLSFFLMAMLISLVSFAAETTATLSFADKAQRTVFNSNQQVWTQNGITLTNDKAASTNAVADYAKPARFYAGSKLTVSCEGTIKQIVFDCNSSSYATTLKNSITSGATVTVSSDKVTAVPTTEASEFVVAKLTAQVRMDAITVTYAAEEENPDATIYTITATSANETMGTVVGAGEYAEGKTVTLTANANPGYEFVKWSNESTENPLIFEATENVTLTASFVAQTPITIAEANKLADGATCVLKEFVVTYVYKGYTHIQDESGATLLFKYDFGLKAGDKVTGLTASKSTYNGLAQLAPTCAVKDLTVVAGEAPAVPEVTTAPTGNYQTVVKLVNVKMAAGKFTTSSNATLVATCPDGTTINVFNGKNLTYEFTADKTYNITGGITQYSNKIQVSAYAVEEYVAPEPCTLAEEINWDEAINAEANTDQWYAVNVASAIAAGKDLALTVTNPGTETVEITIEAYADCPATELIVKSTKTFNAGETKTTTVKYDEYLADQVEVVYLHVVTSGDLTIDTEAIEPCSKATAINWNDPIAAAANLDAWYAVNVESAIAAGKDLALTVSNPSTEAVEVSIEAYANCPATELIVKSTSTINAGASKTTTVKYDEYLADQVKVVYMHVTTKGGEIKVEAESVKFNVTATAENGTVEGAGIYEQGAEATLKATPAEGYEFVNWTVDGTEVSTENPYKFTVTADVALVANFKKAAPAMETVYFINNKGWSKVNAYAWEPVQNANWPGVAATKEAEQIGGYDVYSYTADAGKYANVIFNNGSGSQTADLKWTAGKYVINNQWYTKEEAEAQLVKPVEYEYVYFVNVQAWNKVNIYTWTPEVGTWPGVAMTKEAEQLAGYDVYSYKAEKGTSFGGVIFNNGSGVQTGDLKWTAGKYYVKDGWYTKEEAEAKLAGPVTPPVITYVLMGVKGDWTTGIAMTQNADNVNEYVLLQQEILEGDAVKVVTLTDGTATAWCGNVDEYSVAHTADDMGNIVLAPGKYDFYFKVKEDLIYIGAVKPEVITYELNGGEFPAVVVPTNAELWEAFKPYYNEYYLANGKLTTPRADQPIENVTTFAANYMMDIMTDAASEYKWLGDYVAKVTTDAGRAIDTEVLWRFGVAAFFNCKAEATSTWNGNADFTEAGKPEAWGAAYEAEYGVVLPTEPVAEDYVLPTPTKEGYTFVGWYDNAEGTGEPYKVIPAGWAGTLYAIWKANGPTTALDNIAVEGKAVKAIINGQLIIIKNGVQYNAQGVILK